MTISVSGDLNNPIIIILLCSYRQVKPQEAVAASLARVGSQAALSFAFAFLRRAWKSGEDTDLCCDLLQDCTVTMR